MYENIRVPPPPPLNTLGPATRHLKDVLMAGRWLSEFFLLTACRTWWYWAFYIFVRFRSLLLIKS